MNKLVRELQRQGTFSDETVASITRIETSRQRMQFAAFCLAVIAVIGVFTLLAIGVSTSTRTSDQARLLRNQTTQIKKQNTQIKDVSDENKTLIEFTNSIVNPTSAIVKASQKTTETRSLFLVNLILQTHGQPTLTAAQYDAQLAVLSTRVP